MRTDDHRPSPGAGDLAPDTERSWRGRTHSAASGAARIFKEFKWGLLTLFLLMVVVIGLVYDGDMKRKEQRAQNKAVPQAGPEALKAPARETQPKLHPLAEEGRPPARPRRDGASGRSLAERSAQPRPPLQVPSTRAFRPALPDEPPPQPPQVLASPSTRPARTAARLNGVRGGPDASRSLPGEPPSATPIFKTPAAASASPARSYQVQSGDTLSGIAQRFYPGHVQTGLRMLADVNRSLFSDPRRMCSGMVLRVPVLTKQPSPRNALAQPASPAFGAAKATAAKEAASPRKEYVVQPGDTLERIARKLFGNGSRWQDLFAWNRDRMTNPRYLRAGQKLRIRRPERQPPARPRQAAPSKQAKRDSTVALQPAPAAPAAENSESRPQSMERTASSSIWLP